MIYDDSLVLYNKDVPLFYSKVDIFIYKCLYSFLFT